ncbi:MAG: glycosyltransferase [bacterium]
MSNVQPQADYLFETSWEVCNKVGGIYTVLKSKAAQTVERYADKYYLVGPYFTDKVKGNFQEETPEGAFKHAFDTLAQEGIICHVGTWLIEGEPRIILIDFSKYWYALDEIKRLLWEWYGIDSLHAQNDFNEPILWSWAAGRLIELLHEHLGGNGASLVAQFHEWLTGSGLLYLEHKNISVGTVFTTHATVLGRTLAGNNVPLYDLLQTINPDTSAKEYGVISKHLIEKNAAQKANIFTTVSHVTAIEAQHFLGREADIILPNGLDIEKFPTLDEIAIQHRIQNRRIRSFIQKYFFPYYSFDLSKTLIYFTVGRYEFHNKGIDLYIKALGELNKKLKIEKEDQTIVAFIWVPSSTTGIRPDVIATHNAYEDITDSYEEVTDDINDNIVNALITEGPFSKAAIFKNMPEFMREMKRKTMRFQREGVPPLTTHTLSYPNDAIINACTEAGLGNRKNDSVKIVFFPEYLTGNDGILDLNYYESIQSADFGVFPSFYEPWGYTPLEAAALGIPSVTTDLAGFGKFLKEQEEPREFPGVYVLERFQRPDHEIVQTLSAILFRFSQCPPQDRAKDKIHAREIAADADWSIFINNYVEAHNKALL